MMIWLSRKLSNFFIKHDPKVQAFNSFYNQLNQSKVYIEVSKELQGHPHPCYNLCDEDTYGFLREWLNSIKEETLLEWGCGQAPLLSLGDFSNLSYTGMDFSGSAISFSKDKFPHQSFLLHHQNFRLPFNQKFKRGVAIDSLYSSNGKDIKKSFSQALNFVKEELIVIQNLYGFESAAEAEEKLIPKFQGWQVGYENKTLSFKQLIASWHQALQRPEVVADTKKYLLLWGTISREIAHHKKLLNKEGDTHDKNLFRYLIRYQKIH